MPRILNLFTFQVALQSKNSFQSKHKQTGFLNLSPEKEFEGDDDEAPLIR